MIGSKEQAAIDSTGFESTTRSSHYAWRMGRRYPHAKMAQNNARLPHADDLIAVALLSVGPSQDSPLFEEALYKAVWHLDIDCLLADGGYDAEHNHVLAREGLGIRSTVINVNRRGRAPEPCHPPPSMGQGQISPADVPQVP